MGRARSVIALVCVGLWNVATAVAEERAFTRVRGADDTMRALIREGDARSESFRAMVDEIHRSNAVVMVQFGFCANGQVRSCVVNVHGDARQRHIRILVDTRTTNDRLIATIAHELHHSLEIIRTPEVTTGEQVLALYRRIAKGRCGKGLDDRCETEAALATEATVLGELDRRPPPRP